jgi:hypothetical protein
MLEELLPLSPNRLIFARGYRAGKANWPLSVDGRVHDAKFVTVVGAALSQAIQNKLIEDWILKVGHHPRMLTQNWWGVPDGERLDPLILEPSETEKTVPMQVGAVIGRKLLPGESAPEPVYILRWQNREWRNGPGAVVDVTFKRVDPVSEGAGESLMIQSAKGLLVRTTEDGQSETVAVTQDDLELKLCTLQHGRRYWLDTGRFEVLWPEGTNT